MLEDKAALTADSSLEPPPGVPQAWVQCLKELLAPLDTPDGSKGRAGLSRDIIAYVLTSEPRAILGELNQRPEVAKLLGLDDQRLDRLGRPDVYEHFAAVPAPVGLRWAHVLLAAVPALRTHCRLQLPRGLQWPEVFMVAGSELGLQSWTSDKARFRSLGYRQIEPLLLQDGLPAEALLVACFASPLGTGYASYGTQNRLRMITAMPDYAQALERHVEAVREHLLPSEVAQRAHVLEMLEQATPATLERLAPQLAELAVASARQVRLPAQALLRRAGDAVWPPLRALAVDAKPEQRIHALRLLHALGHERQCPDEVAFAQARAAADKAPSVQALVDEWLRSVQAAAQRQDRPGVERPVIDWSAKHCGIPDDVLSQFWSELNGAIERANEVSRAHHAHITGQGYKHPLFQEPVFNEEDVAALRDYLASGHPQLPKRRFGDGARRWHLIAAALQRLANADGVTPGGLLKALLFFNVAAAHNGSLSLWAIQAFEATHRRLGRPTLLELSCMLDEAGLVSSALLLNYCSRWSQPFASDWPSEHVWPYFAYHLDPLLQALLNDTIKDYSFSRAGLFRALATLPQLPAQAVDALYAVALGAAKTDRAAAQAALQGYPDKELRIIAALLDGKADTRAVAAQWLGRLRHAPAVPALEQAVAREKHDVAKGAMLDALQRLDQPVEKYFDRAALAKDATKALAKGTPKDLEWFPWDALPSVRWADDGSLVPRDVLCWLLVQAVRQKSPEPNAVLRKTCAMFEPRDREALGQCVLELWLREDVRPIAPDEAARRAAHEAQTTHAQMAAYPQWYKDSPHLGKSVEELTAAFLPGQLRQPEGSAIGSKGLLAVAAACALEHAAAPVQRYLKEWYGTRAAQGKALIAMLAWIEHPSATQLMLSIGTRFRTKSFQEEATRQAEALAERKGWTLAELADRTVPTAGFDDDGVLELSYGQRQFKALLRPDFKTELFSPEGKKITALPEPRRDDDAELAKEAKKALSAAKKELKGIVELQTLRLYEALCTQREWSFEDWSAYLQRHPVLRHLVQRLVWVEMDGEGRVRCSFRPLDDGTLTDRDDDPVQLAADARVRLAHDSLLDADDVQAWQQHLLDYEVAPLFQQLGKGFHVLPEGRARDTELKDFEGWLIETFALRGRATKLGYGRGETQDGGWFYTYEKRFPTLGVKAVVEFTGNGLPEENRVVALLGLSFHDTAASWGHGRAGLPLSSVPKVLLSECFNDMRLMAAEGTGYDADWRNKSTY